MRTFVLLGMTGVGKSSFINSVFGEYIAETAPFEACTKVVNHYARGTPYGNLKIIDTPGLSEDGLPLDHQYLGLINDFLAAQRYRLIYISKLNENRFRACEKRTIKIIGEQLGTNSWKDSWIVFTFAGSVECDRVDEACSIRRAQIEGFIGDVVHEGPFNFSHTVLIDNEVVNWSAGGRPAAEILLE